MLAEHLQLVHSCLQICVPPDHAHAPLFPIHLPNRPPSLLAFLLRLPRAFPRHFAALHPAILHPRMLSVLFSVLTIGFAVPGFIRVHAG